MTYFVSAREGQLFGSFHYPYAIIKHSMSRDAVDVVVRRLAQKQSVECPGESEGLAALIDVGYQAASFLHETRHFHDQFGTLAGISLYGQFIDLLKTFYAAAVRIKADGTRWHSPVKKWVAQKDSPTEVRRLIRNVHTFYQGSDLLLGAFRPLEIDGHIDDLLIEGVTNEGHIIDLATIRCTATQDGRSVAKTILYPLGLEVLLEANAHPITRHALQIMTSKRVVDSLEDHLLVEHNKGERPDHARQMLPYMILDRMISKYIRANGKVGNDKFLGDTVLGVADEVLSLYYLSIEHISDTDARVEVPRAGRLIERALAQTPIDDLIAGAVPASDLVTQVYRATLQSFEKGRHWETVEDDRSLMSSIRIWGSYVAQHFIVPLLRRRLATNHQVFRSGDGMMELSQELSSPIVAFDGRMEFDLPDRVRLAWAHVLMAGQLAESAALRDTVLCPRAFATVPGLSNCSFSREYDCDDYVSIGCGKFDGITIENTPCMFVDLLRDLGFIQ